MKHVEWVKVNELRLKKKKTAEEGYPFQPKLYRYIPPNPLAVPLQTKTDNKTDSGTKSGTDKSSSDEVKSDGVKGEVEARAIARTDGLFLNAAIREEKRGMLRDKIWKEECSFHPVITTKGHKSDHMRGFPFMATTHSNVGKGSREGVDCRDDGKVEETSFGYAAGSIPGSAAMETTDRLYRQSVYREALREMKQLKLEEEMLNKCTFQPHLPKAGLVPPPPPVPSPKEKSKPQTQEKAVNNQPIKESGSSFLARVCANQRLAESRLEEKKKKLEEEEMKPHTFQPALATKDIKKSSSPIETNKVSDKESQNDEHENEGIEDRANRSYISFSGTTEKQTSGPVDSVFERLHKGNVKKAQVIEKVSQIVQKETAKKFPFKPNVSKTALGKRRKDKMKLKFSSNVCDVKEVKSECAVNNPILFSHTNIDVKSSKQGSQQEVHNRLYADGSRIARLNFEAQEEKRRNELKGYTFEPVINETETDKGKSSRRTLNTQDMLALKSLRVEVAKMRELEHCTFTPKVGRSPKKSVPGFKPFYSESGEQGVSFEFEDDVRPVYERLNAQKVLFLCVPFVYHVFDICLLTVRLIMVSWSVRASR